MSDEPDCPYLLRETLTWRESLDLTKDSPMRVAVSWQCAHPFHGLKLSLGDDLDEMRRLCAGCALPRPGRPESEGGTQHDRRRDDVASADVPTDEDVV